MYYRHFGLDGAPFRFVPSGRDLFMSRAHREALEALEWGVLYEPSGFTLLIGEAGTGKTTLVKSILARNYERVRAACISNPKRGFEGMLRELLRQFGLAGPATKLDMSATFERFIEQLKAGERVVVLIDEAQALDDESLEELRLFSNVGNSDEKQLNFVLVGQPELMHRLLRPELRQFNDRIGARAVLNPLSASEARSYLDFRLRAHGGSCDRIFEPAAVDYIVAHSGGIPRRINVLGHNSMLLAYSGGKRKVDLQAAREAANEYENLLGRTGSEKKRVPGLLHWRRLGVAAVGLAGLVTLILFQVGIVDGPGRTVTSYSGDLALKPHVLRLSRFDSTSSEAAASLPSVGTGGKGGSEGGLARPLASPKVASASSPPAQPGRWIRVRRGDSLQRLAIRYLGSQQRLASLIQANPQLRNFNLIYPGQMVYLPASTSQE